MDEGGPEPKRPRRPGARKAKYWGDLIHGKITHQHPDCTTHGRLDPHQILRSPKDIKEFYSGHDVHPSRNIDNEKFARWAIEEALQPYDPQSNFKITGNDMEGQSVQLREISHVVQANGHQDVDAEDPNGPKDQDSEIEQDVSAVTETILSASPNSLGPPVEACASYLQMTQCGTFGRNNQIVWASPFFPGLDGQNGRRGFLSNQIMAIVWIMANFLGKLPRLKLKTPDYWNEDTGKYEWPLETKIETMHRKRLRRPRYFGAILADSMGLGKTMTTIACLDLMANQTIHVERDANGNINYRPILILTPNIIVASQWVDEIEQIGSQRSIKQIIISGEGAQKKDGQTRTRVLKAREFREWPDSLNYVWDEDDQRAARTIIVMSIDTWASRTCANERVENGNVKLVEWYSTFNDMGRRFSIVVVDEAYKVRNPATRYWKSVALLQREYTLLITATPCMNLLKDLMGPVRLLWERPGEYLKENRERWEKIDRKFMEPQDLRILDGMMEFDDHQLIAGRPAILKKLIDKYKASSIDIQTTRKYLKYFEGLAILRRAPSSHLYWDWEHTQVVSLDGLLPSVSNFTVNIQLDHILEESYQNTHMDLLILFMEILKKVQIHRRQKRTKKDSKENEYIGSALTTYFHFELAAASMDVYRLEQIFSLNKFGIKAEYVRSMRGYNVNFMHIAPFLLDRYEAKPKTALDHIKLAVRNSPILRYILHHVKENLLNRKPGERIKKLLIIESRPILAYYYELVLQFLLVNCRTLHAGLSGEQRRDLIASFNDDHNHSCQILIQMYSVGFAGSNLHKNCSEVLVATQAHSFPVQMQAVHRVIRVGQMKDVRVYRLKVNNSYHDFRESRQVEKILPELGSRAQGSMVNVLVQLLNLFQGEVGGAWESPEGKELMDSLNLVNDEEAVISEDEDGDQSEEDGAREDDRQEEDEESDDEEPSTKRPRVEGTDSSSENSKDDSENDSSESDADSQEGDLIRLNDGTAHLFNNNRDTFLRLLTRTEYYREFTRFPGEVRSHFSHTKNNLRRILSYYMGDNKGKIGVWKEEDLNESAVLERAMELTLRVRLGAQNIGMLPTPLIIFTRVPEKKLHILTKLLKDSTCTAHDIDELVEKRREARARRAELRGDSLPVRENLTLGEIDNMFKIDITEGHTGTSRKRRRQEIEEAADPTIDQAAEDDPVDIVPFDPNLFHDLGYDDDWDRSDSEDGEAEEGEEEGEMDGADGDDGDDEAFDE
ncbi:SNF2 family N-terminal domain-containing protein [Annulohypoxylon moriforme]|nr:SNF2 family N-terminal domain-containing protein [Annulohypoxylon moriforme]